MFYIKSTSQCTYTVKGKVIPANVTPNNDYLVVDGTFVASIKKSPVIKSLIDSGSILILDKEPTEVKNSITGLTKSNAALIAENNALKEQLKSAGLGEDMNALKKEALDEINKRQAALDEANAEIEKLRAQLAKKGKKTSTEEA